MKTNLPIVFLLCVLLLSPCLRAQQQQLPAPTPPPAAVEINTTLMETTFSISGPSSRPGEGALMRAGAGFVMLRRLRANSDEGQYVLVTAKHVFEDIRGDVATLVLRKKDADGNPTVRPFDLHIRANNKNLYTSHPTEDVSAIDLTLPNETIIVQLRSAVTNVDWLVTDSFADDLQLHPGDELLCLGFPLGASWGPGQYPLLRSGKIASYPIMPFKKIKKILYDFRVFPGNSGGPVYFAYSFRPYKGKLHFGMTYQKLFGIVTQQADPIQNQDPSLGAIVPAVYIKETIDLLAGFESPVKDAPPE